MFASIILIWRDSEAKAFRYILLFILHGFISLVFGSPLSVIHQFKKMILVIFLFLRPIRIRSSIENVEIVLQISILIVLIGQVKLVVCFNFLPLVSSLVDSTHLRHVGLSKRIDTVTNL